MKSLDLKTVSEKHKTHSQFVQNQMSACRALSFFLESSSGSSSRLFLVVARSHAASSIIRLSNQKGMLQLARQDPVATRPDQTGSSVNVAQSQMDSSASENEDSHEVYYMCSDIDNGELPENMASAADNFILWKKGAENGKF